MKLYMYIRLSNADRDLKYKAESDSISNQRLLLHQYVQKSKEFMNCEIEEFVDDGYSGTNDRRPAFEQMIQNLKNGECKVVICKDFSRFFRDYIEIGDYLERIFPFLGVRFISINDHYDSKDYQGTTGGMDVVMRAIVYSYYSKDQSRKLRSVWKEKAKKGEFVGAYAPYGYDRDPNDKHHLVLDPPAASVVRRIFDMALMGKGTSDIARSLNESKIDIPSKYMSKKFPDNRYFKEVRKNCCWYTSMVRDILVRREYTGAVVDHGRTQEDTGDPAIRRELKRHWIVVPDCHEAIISQEEYEQAQTVIKRGGGRKQITARSYLLRSLVRCGVCGRIMVRNASRKTITYWCYKSKDKTDTMCPAGIQFSEADLEQVVRTNFLQMMNQISEYEKQVKSVVTKQKGTESYVRQSLVRIGQTLKQNKLMKMTGYERYSDGSISRGEFMALKCKLDAELAELISEKEQLEKQLSDLENAVDPQLKQITTEANRVLKAEEVTNEMLLYFIKQIDVYSENGKMRVEIRYKFQDVFRKILEQ